MKKIKRKIFDIIRIENKDDLPSTIFDIFIAGVIFINLFITFFVTFDKSEPYKELLLSLEFITIIIFAIEYVLRIWTADLLYVDVAPNKARLKFIFSFFGIIDLLTFLPYIVPIFFPTGMIAFRLLRVVRIFHLFRINSSYDSFKVIVEVLTEKKNQILSAVMLMLVLMFGSSLCMYHLEHDVQPEVFKNAFSGIWWSVSAILTVGYGDIYPITLYGQIFAIIISILGVGIVAIPTGIITTGFYEKAQKIKRLDSCAMEHSLRFITTIVNDTHPWKDKKIKDIELPEDILISVIERIDNIVMPYGELELKENDRVVLAALNYTSDNSLEVKEMLIKEKHPWKDKLVKELNISRQTVLLSIKRKYKIIIPRGSTRIKENDIVLLCRKNNHIDEYDEYYI